jgi:tRNA modification GTPase
MTPPPIPTDASVRVLTPPGEGGISVLALWGPAAPEILARCVRARRDPRTLAPGRLAYGHVLDEAGRPLDEIVLAALPDARTPAYEINCHGGAAPTRAVLRRLTQLGARPADAPPRPAALAPLERDVAERLPHVWTPLGVQVLSDQLDGRLRRALRRLRDLPDPRRMADALEDLAASARFGLLLTAPPVVALAGAPNAGKSTLMNRLLRRERVLVYHQPGTTRDVVTEIASVHGIPVLLSDTAGIGPDTAPAPEPDVLAARMAWAETARARLVLVLFDASRPPTAPERELAGRLRPKAVFAANKIDLPGADPAPYEPLAGGPLLAVSAREGDGIDELLDAVARRLGGPPPYEGRPTIVCPAHADALERALEALRTEGPDAARALLDPLLAGPAT